MSSSASSTSNTPCAACKFMRRRCTETCLFAPYFPAENSEKFTNVHRAYGASNFARILKELEPSQREEAVNTLCFEASQRCKNPIYGCVGWIAILQQRIEEVQHDIDAAMRELATCMDQSDMLLALNEIGRQCYGPSFEMTTQSYNDANNQVMTMGIKNNDNTSNHQQKILEQLAALREQEMRRNYFGQHRVRGNKGGLGDDDSTRFDQMVMESPSSGLGSSYNRHVNDNQMGDVRQSVQGNANRLQLNHHLQQQHDQELLLLQQQINSAGNIHNEQLSPSAHEQKQVNSDGHIYDQRWLLLAHENQQQRSHQSYRQITQQTPHPQMKQQRSHPQINQQRSHPQMHQQLPRANGTEGGS